MKQKDITDFTPGPLKSTRSHSAIDTDQVMLVVVNIVQLQNQQFQHQWWSKQKTRAEIEASLQNSECRHVNVSTFARPGLQNWYYSFIRQCNLLNSTFSPLLAVSSGRLTPNHYPSPWQRAVKFESSFHGLLCPLLSSPLLQPCLFNNVPLWCHVCLVPFSMIHFFLF